MALGRSGRLAIVASVILVPVTIRASLHGTAAGMEGVSVSAGMACVQRKIAALDLVRSLTKAEEQACWREGDAAAGEARKRTIIITAVNVLTVLFLIWVGGLAAVRTARWVRDGKAH